MAAIPLRDMHPDPRKRTMEHLWTRMAGIYGASRWEREYGAEPSRAWTDGLGGMTMNQLAEGIGIADRDTSGRIPVLGLFRSWCLSGTADRHEPLPSLEHLAGETPAGVRWLAFMRLEGVLPTPENITPDDIETALEDCNIADMRDRVQAELNHLRNRYTPH